MGGGRRPRPTFQGPAHPAVGQNARAHTDHLFRRVTFRNGHQNLPTGNPAFLSKRGPVCKTLGRLGLVAAAIVLGSSESRVLLRRHFDFGRVQGDEFHNIPKRRGGGRVLEMDQLKGLGDWSQQQDKNIK